MTNTVRSLLAALALLALSSPSPAWAQGTPTTAPGLRIDLDVPSIGVGASSLEDDPALTIAAQLRIAARTGDGGFFGATGYDGTPELDLFGPKPAHATAWLFDLGYLRRFRLTGDDRLGLGLDVQGGFSIGSLEFHQATNGLCWDGCPDPPQVPESVANGLHAGANVGASLDARLWGFTIGVDARYRLMAALEPGDAGDRRDQHVLSAGVHLGFAIY